MKETCEHLLDLTAFEFVLKAPFAYLFQKLPTVIPKESRR